MVPELATVVPSLENGGISRDNRTITYHLRKGVSWQDGVPFSADDVIFTWHAVMNKRNNVPSTVGYDLIDSIERKDPWTIVVHLRRPYAPFISTFFGPSGNPYVVLPVHLLGKFGDLNHVQFNSKPVGTGPFVMERWQRGSKIVFRANPHYWRGAPKLREIWYTPIPDENTIVTLLKSHEADLEYNGAAANYPQYAGIAGARTQLTTFTQYGQLALNVRSPVLADVRVRRALWLAIDIKRFIADVSHGVNVPGYTDQPSFSWAYNPNTVHYDYDQAKARALLDAAGWKPGPDGVRDQGRPATATAHRRRPRFGKRQRDRGHRSARLARDRHRGLGQELRLVALLRELRSGRDHPNRKVRRRHSVLDQRRRSRRLDPLDVRSDPAQRSERLPLLRPDAWMPPSGRRWERTIGRSENARTIRSKRSWPSAFRSSLPIMHGASPLRIPISRTTAPPTPSRAFGIRTNGRFSAPRSAVPLPFASRVIDARTHFQAIAEEKAMSWIGNNLLNSPYAGLPRSSRRRHWVRGMVRDAAVRACSVRCDDRWISGSGDYGGVGGSFGGDGGRGLSALMSGFASYVNNLFNQIAAWYGSGATAGSANRRREALRRGIRPPVELRPATRRRARRLSEAKRLISRTPRRVRGAIRTIRSTERTRQGQTQKGSWDNMRSHADLLDSNSFAGGYRVATQVSQPNAQGVTMNQSASIATAAATAPSP